MEKKVLANLANYSDENSEKSENNRLSRALDAIAEILKIEHGSLTIFFRNGRWSPRIEIQKSVQKEIELTQKALGG